jgi:hypothetical protein
MHYILHVIHPKVSDENLDELLSELMAPFYEELEVEPYRDYVSLTEFDKVVKYYSEKGEDLSNILELLNDWRGGNHQHDGELTTTLDLAETDTGYYKWSTWNPRGEWDWWVTGGRWSGYFGEDEATGYPGNDTVTVLEALEYMGDPQYDWMAEGPYVYLTLEGEWVGKTTYNPNGKGYDENDPNSCFPNNPDYMYREYLTHVSSIPDMMVTAVDFHC